ncbi:MAG: hypothetical protein E3K32_07525 [wastewater metagenome]|nr:hypothetical protein [Candidatus Loosdrechtia aerotolerans]
MKTKGLHVCIVFSVAFLISIPVVKGQGLLSKLAAADADKDGKVSKDEIVLFVKEKSGERITGKFEKMDTNTDGFLTKNELKGEKIKKFKLSEVDTNEDGKLTKEEITDFVQKKAGEKAVKLFLKLDTDEDGFVTAEEVKQAKKTKKHREEKEEEEIL